VIRLLQIALCLTIIGLWPEVLMAAEAKALRITVVYNNVAYAPELETAWGFAAVLESTSGTVLFDTGGDGRRLLANMQRLGLEPEQVDAVVLSHIHGDHTGGLDEFLARNSGVTVYLPQSFPVGFRRAVEQRGARVETVGGPQRLFGNVYSTGEMDQGTKEQALIVDTEAGLVVVTGCAHPDIVDMAKAAREYLRKDIYLLMGGFHLLGRSESQLRGILRALRDLRVRKVAPSHCTGDEAIALFRETWKKEFIEGGCGATIQVP
jgi:7,8-dihydropterin-6-yl-methyl-4-(beta-D-ribofuranosyl)aminobenzene 5'-phosphate synthase